MRHRRREPASPAPRPASELQRTPELLAVEVEGLGKYYGLGKGSILGRGGRAAKRKADSEILDDDVDDVDDVDDDDDEGGEAGEGGEGGRFEGSDGLWALRDLSFSLQRGESIGITGPSGCGKSTLIRILSRHSRPTEGRVVLRGKAVPVLPAILALFRKDNSVRKNVTLASLFLGFPAERAAERMDDISAFAGLKASSMDRPLRQLSREQLQRLTYSTVLGLGADILLADDVIAGADREFRDRCFDLLREQRSRGLALVYATHDPAMLRELCHIGILLDNGRAVAHGPAEDIAAEWEIQAKNRRLLAAPGLVAANGVPPPDPVVRFAVYGLDGRPVDHVASSEGILFELTIEIEEAPLILRCALLVEDEGSISRIVPPDTYSADVAGRHYASLYVAPHVLGPGRYRLFAAVFVEHAGGRTMLGQAPGVTTIDVVEDAGEHSEQRSGGVAIDAVWSIRPANEREVVFDDATRMRPDADSPLARKQQLATARRAVTVMREAQRREEEGADGRQPQRL